MSRTYAYALLGAVIATFTVTPCWRRSCCPASGRRSRLSSCAHPQRLSACCRWRSRNRRAPWLSPSRLLVLCTYSPARLGTEFLPKLEEGNIWIRALLPPTITLEAGMDTVARIRKVILELRAGARPWSRSRGGARRAPIRTAPSWRNSSSPEAFRRVAERPDKGETGQRAERATQSRVHWRRLQLLPVHPGQHRGSRFWRQRARTQSRFSAAILPSWSGCRNRLRGDRQGAGRARSRRIQSAGPAQPCDQDQPRERRPLRLLGRRHQRGGTGGDRWPGGDARL